MWLDYIQLVIAVGLLGAFYMIAKSFSVLYYIIKNLNDVIIRILLMLSEFEKFDKDDRIDNSLAICSKHEELFDEVDD